MTGASGGISVTLFHWNQEELDERVPRLEEAGFRVVQRVWDSGGGFVSALDEAGPDAVVIDLGRLPSHGREVATYLRRRKKSRGLPLVFVDGSPEKVAPIRELLPDAVYTEWEGIAAAVRGAVAEPPSEPVVPPDRHHYTSRPLAAKLRIGEGDVMGLLAAPPGFEATLGALPEGASTTREADAPADITIWFVRDRAALEAGIDEHAGRADAGGLWIAWPKKASEMESDLAQSLVQSAALERGLVDYKVCAIDDTWSGLLFSRRRE